LGNAAILVDPYEASTIADGIVTALEDSDLITDLKEKGRIRVNQFSWNHSIKKVKQIYQEVGAEH
jgi:glycosyltransferase involved in cell wall biosynthesis